MIPKVNLYDYSFKFLVVGTYGTGKTSIIFRFVDDEPPNMATICGDFKVRTITLDGKIIKLQIWDTAGVDRMRTITSGYVRNSHAVVIVYDKTNLDSFSDVGTVWVPLIKNYVGEAVDLVLVGNKSDLESESVIDFKTGEEFAVANSMLYYETSAKKSTNIEELFINLAFTSLYKKMKQDLDSEERELRSVKLANLFHTNKF